LFSKVIYIKLNQRKFALMYTIENIQAIAEGIFLQQASNNAIVHLAIDSRKIIFATETLFFAITASHRDGHDFIEQAYKKGIRNFIVEKKIDTDQYSNANFLQVSNSTIALQKIAAHHRTQFNLPVIGITGSNGKTIVKEWLFQLLESDYSVVRSPKSYNSQIGVALSVWSIQAHHQLGIFEAGISTKNEMVQLQKMIQPTIGILTNIGNAHSEGFENNLEKLQEKLKLFTHAQVLIYCSTHDWINQEIEQLDCKKISWGHTATAHIQVLRVEKFTTHSQIHLAYSNQQSSIALPFTDDASIENAMHGVTTLVYLGYTLEQISDLLATLEPVAMRLEQKRGIHNCVLINDSYSNDMDSLQIALDYLQQQNPALQKTVVLTDILQTGKNKQVLYEQVAALLVQKNIKVFIGIGPDLMAYQSLFTAFTKVSFFPDVATAMDNMDADTFANQAILLKGARTFGLEAFVHILEEKVHQTILEIQLDRVVENVKKHQQLLYPSTQIMAIVKAFGYGSGATEIATTLQNLKIDYLAVAYADEGISLRKAGIHLPIMVMNTDAAAFDALLEYDLEPEIFSFPLLHAFLHFAKQHALVQYPVHIKLDTGMHRLGFEEQDMETLISVLKSNSFIQVKTVFSHLVGSEEVQLDAFTQEQNTLFLNYCTQLESHLGYPFIKHIANSTAILRHPNLQHQMVRIGIGMYGVTPNNLGLQQVCTLKTTIAQIKTLKKGDTVGYNRKGVLTKDCTIATVRIGYADGYSRKLGNGVGKMYLNGHYAPTIGSVCMDMTMLDITNIPNVQVDDYVIVFGDELTVLQVAAWADTIPYEILTGISQRVKRIYYG
jgi:Alr-MurF fusion protein